MWALTMSKDFRIAPCIRKIDMPKLFTLGLNNPVQFLIENNQIEVKAKSLFGIRVA